MKKSLHLFFLVLLLPMVLWLTSCEAPTVEPTGEPTVEPLVQSDAQKMPFDASKLRGFNLQSKILVGDWVNGDAQPWAFQFMADQGFNFARIPMEVDQLFEDAKYTVWRQSALEEIDRIIALGRQYNILILLDLHTLPGIRPSALPPSDRAFDDAQRLAIWVNIFEVLSERYKDVPNTELCYNLINEPYAIETEAYRHAIEQVREVIRRVDATKVLFIDPNDWEGKPSYWLTDLNDPYLVATPHFYQPFGVTHYLAEWVEGADQFPPPQYPSVNFNGYLYGNAHPQLQQPLTLKGSFLRGDELKIRIDQISNNVDLWVQTNRETLLKEHFQTNGDPSQWKEVHFNTEWQIYQNVYDQDRTMVLTEDATQITLQIPEGDWLDLSQLSIKSANWSKPFQLVARSFDWGLVPATFYIDSSGNLDTNQSSTNQIIDKAYLEAQYYSTWTDFQQKTKIPVVACEFGVYNKTGHDISLNVVADMVTLFNKHNIGYALWNFSGPFGIFDSNRIDVDYEDYNGRKLDRKMLDLIKP